MLKELEEHKHSTIGVDAHCIIELSGLVNHFAEAARLRVPWVPGTLQVSLRFYFIYLISMSSDWGC